MARVFDSWAQYKLYLDSRIAIALDNTMEILLIKLQNIIDDVVYGWHSSSDNPWEIYRTGQFLDSWEKTKPTLVGNILQGEISQNIDIMQQFFINSVEVHGDRDDLADIIISGDGYQLSDNIPERDFWSPWILWVHENLNSIFYQECAKLNIPIQKVGMI